MPIPGKCSPIRDQKQRPAKRTASAKKVFFGANYYLPSEAVVHVVCLFHDNNHRSATFVARGRDSRYDCAHKINQTLARKATHSSRGETGLDLSTCLWSLVKTRCSMRRRPYNLEWHFVVLAAYDVALDNAPGHLEIARMMGATVNLFCERQIIFYNMHRILVGSSEPHELYSSARQRF